MPHRLERINKLLQQQLSLEVQKEFAHDLGIISVNAVYTSKDLKSAKVYVSILNHDKKITALNKLQKKAHYLEHCLLKKLSVKYIPKLEFIFDESQEKIARIEELLSKIDNSQRAL